MRKNWILWYAIVLHGSWVIALLSSPAAMGSTGVAALAALGLDRGALALALGVAVCCSLYDLQSPPRQRWLRIGLLLPQQFALCVSALGALQAIVSHQFADGVPRDPWFIASDQMHYVIAAAFHTAAVFQAGERAR